MRTIFEKRHISFKKISLGNNQFVNIPIATLKGSKDSPHILIIGGMDGDEYAGIEACYRLIEMYKETQFAGTLTIIPILNVPGFYNESSKNPLDDKFPKQVFPGSENGTPTEQLMFWLSSEYTGVAAWVELHGGALTERIRPLVWMSETGIKSIDTISAHIVKAMQHTTVVHDVCDKRSRQYLLAQHGTVHILSESGSRGEYTETDVERHIHWVQLVMHEFGMIDIIRKTDSTNGKVIRNVHYVTSDRYGIAQMSISQDFIEKGEFIGSIRYIDKDMKERQLYAPCTGHILWHKETMAARPGDVLCAIGTEYEMDI